MHWSDYLIIATVIVAALFGLYGFIKHLKKARIIEDTPTSKIRSASQGYAELNGFAKPADGVVLPSPLTHKPCLWYRYSVERYESNGKSSSWRTVESKTSQHIFSLDDSTGTCYIYPNKAEFSSCWKDVWHGDTRHPIQSSKRRNPLAFLSSRRYRYTEERIHEDDFLYALGMFQTIRAPSPLEQTKTVMAELLTEWKEDYDKLLAQFDTNEDGKLDMQEWEVVRKAALVEAKKKVYNHPNDADVHVLVTPPKNMPFIISNKDPKQLSSRYRWTAIGMAMLFVGASGLTVHLLQEFT